MLNAKYIASNVILDCNVRMSCQRWRLFENCSGISMASKMAMLAQRMLGRGSWRVHGFFLENLLRTYLSTAVNSQLQPNALALHQLKRAKNQQLHTAEDFTWCK